MPTFAAETGFAWKEGREHQEGPWQKQFGKSLSEKSNVEETSERDDKEGQCGFGEKVCCLMHGKAPRCHPCM